LFVFKVASLRNVQLTPPYLHDGSIKQLGQAVRLMGRHQLGVDLTEDQVSDIRAYLASLTGRMPLVAADRAPGGDR
jgi:cytochrome c peroxidase